MILNLSIDYQDIERTANHFNLNLEKELIIDCSATMKLSHKNFFSVCEIENFETLHDQVIRNYIKEVGKTSVATDTNNSSVREIKVLEHAIVWLTVFAVKRPDNSLGKTVYLLDSILPLIMEKFNNQKIYVSAPLGNEHFSMILERIFKKHGIENFYLIKKQQLLLYGFLRNSIQLIKFYIRCFFLFTFSAPGKKQSAYQNYFISHPTGKFDNDYQDFFLSDTKYFSDTITKGRYWPMFSEYSQVKRSKSFLYREYTDAFPGILQLCQLIIKSFFKLISFRWKSHDNEGQFFNDKIFLELEIKKAIVSNMKNIFFGIWLGNYFSTLKGKVNVIYQDEFYESGRIISKTLEKHDHVTTISLQHGIFDLHQTVYGISDLEFSDEKLNPLPAPDFFVVWGDYFKKYFLSNNQFDNNRIISLGNPKYFNLNTSNSPGKKFIHKVLWCTASPEMTANDIAFLKNTILNNPDYEVTLREHPKYKYIEQLQKSLKIFERFPKIKVSTVSSIIDDIKTHDMVIVNSFTTAFLDAYLNGKYCFRIFPYKSYPSYLKDYKSDLIFNIFSEDDVRYALQQINASSRNDQSDSQSKSIMNINVNEWRRLLTNGIANVA